MFTAVKKSAPKKQQEAAKNNAGSRSGQAKSKADGNKNRKRKPSNKRNDMLTAIQRKFKHPVIQREKKQIYATGITGTYDDSQGNNQQINQVNDLWILESKSHPKGKVDYTSYVIKQLKKNGTVPKNATNINITFTTYSKTS